MIPIQQSNHNPMREAHDAPRCQHIRLAGRRCGAPALRGRRLCHFHNRLRRPPTHEDYMLPFIEDASSLQFALMEVMRSIRSGAASHKACGLLLYALQIACLNLKQFREEQDESEFEVLEGQVGESARTNFGKNHEESAGEKEDEPEGESLAALLLRLLRTPDTGDAAEPAQGRQPGQLAAGGPAKFPARPDLFPEPGRAAQPGG